jgi:hypothetical protein
MVDLLRIAFAAATGWFAARSIYILLSPGFVQRRPVLAASVVGSIVGLVIPSVLTAVSGVIAK